MTTTNFINFTSQDMSDIYTGIFAFLGGLQPLLKLFVIVGVVMLIFWGIARLVK